MTVTLYQFPISHYCEKAAWALDYKKIPYRIVNLVPGPHGLIIRSMAPTTSVPVMRHDGTTVQDSTKIIEMWNGGFWEFTHPGAGGFPRRRRHNQYMCFQNSSNKYTLK